MDARVEHSRRAAPRRRAAAARSPGFRARGRAAAAPPAAAAAATRPSSATKYCCGSRSRRSGRGRIPRSYWAPDERSQTPFIGARPPSADECVDASRGRGETSGHDPADRTPRSLRRPPAQHGERARRAPASRPRGSRSARTTPAPAREPEPPIWEMFEPAPAAPAPPRPAAQPAPTARVPGTVPGAGPSRATARAARPERAARRAHARVDGRRRDAARHRLLLRARRGARLDRPGRARHRSARPRRRAARRRLVAAPPLRRHVRIDGSRRASASPASTRRCSPRPRATTSIPTPVALVLRPPRSPPSARRSRSPGASETARGARPRRRDPRAGRRSPSARTASRRPASRSPCSCSPRRPPSRVLRELARSARRVGRRAPRRRRSRSTPTTATAQALAVAIAFWLVLAAGPSGSRCAAGSRTCRLARSCSSAAFGGYAAARPLRRPRARDRAARPSRSRNGALVGRASSAATATSRRCSWAIALDARRGRDGAARLRTRR